MESNMWNAFIIVNADKFRPVQIPLVRQALEGRGEVLMLQGGLKNPMTAFILSFVPTIFSFGLLHGIDRFYIGDICLGILKCITLGGFGIWTLIDWFRIMGVTKDKNFQKITRGF